MTCIVKIRFHIAKKTNTLLRLTMGYHNIMLKAFGGMHSSGQAFFSTLDEMSTPTALVNLVDGLDSVADGDPDLYHKTLRIKSSKAYQWLLNEASLYNTFISVLTNQTLERVLHTFLKWQREDQFLKVGKSPLILMSNMFESPAVYALRRLYVLQCLGECTDDGFPMQELLQGLCFVLLFVMLCFVFVTSYKLQVTNKFV